MLKNGTYYLASIQFHTVTTSVESFLLYALSDFAILAAIGKFHPLRTTPHAIYSRCGNLRRTVHFTPLPGCRFPQFIVIGEGSPAGVAAFAIQSATSYQSLLHPAIFQISLCKYPCLFCPFTLSFPASRFRARHKPTVFQIPVPTAVLRPFRRSPTPARTRLWGGRATALSSGGSRRG